MFARITTTFRPQLQQQLRTFATKAAATPKTPAVPKKVPTTPKVVKDAPVKVAKVAKTTKVVAPKVPKVATKKEPVVKVPKVALPKIKKPKVATEAIGDQAKLYAERRDKFQEQLLQTREKIGKLVMKPEYSKDTYARYEKRISTLQDKVDRAHRYFKMAQYKAEKEIRLKELPSVEELQKMSRDSRLLKIATVDSGIKSAYQLFARELKLTKGGSFSDYINGWKALNQQERAVYEAALQQAKSMRSAAV